MRRANRFIVLLLPLAAAPSCAAPLPAESPHPVEPAVADIPPVPDANVEEAGELGAGASDDGPAATRAPEEAPDRASPRADRTAAEILGTIVARSGDELTVEAGDALRDPGAKGTLYKRFEQEIGPIKATGWLGIADVTVRKVNGRRVVLSIVAEKSIILVNGKKVDHFTSGSEVKLETTP